MQGVGEKLREARIRQGVDIKEVEQATKIRAKYLRALENEEYHVLPAPTFVRMFTRTYAEYLGLDASLLVEEYRAQYEPRGESEMQHFAPAATPRRRRRRVREPSPAGGSWLEGRGGALAITGAVMLLGLILILGLTADEEEGGGAQQSAGEQREKAADKRKERRKPKPAPTSVAVRLSPVEATYMCVENGTGKRLFEGILEAPRTFKAKQVRVNLGKTSVKVRVNGKRVPIAPGARPVGFAFKPTGKPKELPPGRRPCA
jgi:cytoskeleton protein RodZ